MKIVISRIPKGTPVRYFTINSAECTSIWKELRLPKVLNLKEMRKSIFKPKNFLAFTSIIHTFSYSYDLKSRLVEKIIIFESILIFLPKLERIYLLNANLKSRWSKFLKLAILHELIYHYNFYYNKQRKNMIFSLKKLRNPTKHKIDRWITNFNKKLLLEQEKSHLLAPKAKYICSNDYLSSILTY